MATSRTRILAPIALTAALVLTACGGSSDDGGGSSPTASPSPSPTKASPTVSPSRAAVEALANQLRDSIDTMSSTPVTEQLSTSWEALKPDVEGAGLSGDIREEPPFLNVYIWGEGLTCEVFARDEPITVGLNCEDGDGPTEAPVAEGVEAIADQAYAALATEDSTPITEQLTAIAAGGEAEFPQYTWTLEDTGDGALMLTIAAGDERCEITVNDSPRNEKRKQCFP